MIVQFNIVGKNNRKFTYKIKGGKFYRNDSEVTADEYNKALNYFNSSKK